MLLGKSFPNSSSAVSGSFASASPYKLLGIHKVCLRILSRNPDQNLSLPALAEIGKCFPGGVAPLCAVLCLPGIFPVTGFRHRERLHTYSGGTVQDSGSACCGLKPPPDYLVQQTKPYALPATERVFSCHSNRSTPKGACQCFLAVNFCVIIHHFTHLTAFCIEWNKNSWGYWYGADRSENGCAGMAAGIGRA